MHSPVFLTANSLDYELNEGKNMKKFVIVSIILGIGAFLTVCVVNSVNALKKALKEKEESEAGRTEDGR